MDQILSKVWNSRYGKYLLPLSFCVGNLINVMFYYLGLAFQDNIARQTGFVIGNVLFASAAFLALLLVRAAKLTHPLGKLLCLPAALLLVIRFVPGVLYQLSLFPLATPLPFITGNLYSVIDALLLGLSVSALRQSTCPEPPEIRSVQPAVV